jgi:hypothetical protein
MKRFQACVVGLAAVFLGQSALANNSELIRDVEGLRNSLPAKDPSRQSLTLRLADLYFDRAAELGGNPGASEAQLKQLNDARKKAVTLYNEALKGTEYMPAVSGDNALKVKFQLARLYADQNQHTQANPLWKELVEQKQIQRLRQEASLRLAEYYDNGNLYDQADKAYLLAYELCAGGDICSYIQYRRAWLLRNTGNLDAGIEAMKKGLYDSKGRVREEALRDLVVFLAARKDDGTEALPQVEELATKLQRPTLLKDLSDAFFAAGNRKAGAHVLAYVNTKAPTLDAQVRLLEEFYGSRDWEKFRTTAEAIRSAPGPASPEEKDRTNRQNTMKRLLVQLDGERQTKKETIPDFQTAVELYLQLYPSTPETLKMMEGWVVSESDEAKKLAQLKQWQANPVYQLSASDKKKLDDMVVATDIKLHRERAQVAQKGNDYDSIINEANALLALEKGQDSQRELKYQIARALSAQKKDAEALPAFQELAKVSGKPDKWAIQSQHLALSLLGSQKRYADLVAQADTWLGNAAVTKSMASDKDLSKDLEEMKKVRHEADFQQAVAAGQTPQALALFQGFCEAGQFLPQSCDNAKVLAVQLKDQGRLLKVLDKMGSKAELAAEYEAAGYFNEAGKLLEQTDLAKHPDTKAYLKVALMYELGGQLLERNRVLGKLVDSLKNKKSLGEEEPLIFQTLKDAGLINQTTYKLAWSPANRARVAAYLEDVGQGSAATKKDLLASETYAGKGWSRAVLEQLQELDKKQRAVSFYGNNSQARFELRLKALKNVTGFADKYFPGAPSETRAQMADLVAKSHDHLAETILATPIPKELTGAAVDEVKNALVTMAQPFQEKAKEYQQLSAEEAQKAAAPAAVAAAPQAPQATQPGAAPKIDVKAHLQALHEDPTSRASLEGAKQFYSENGNERLAAYFQGRLLQLGQKEEGT